MLETESIQCPFCGQRFELAIDTSVASQRFTTDCEVCCRPFEVVGEFLSYDPYGIMFRKNEPQLAAVVERTFRKLATNHDLVPLYQRWLMDRLPTGERLGVPMSAELEYSFRKLDDSSHGTN